MLRARAGPELFKAEALSHPIGVAGRLVNWRYVAAVGSYHLLALLALVPWFYCRSGVVLALAGVYVFGVAGINLCYHRLLSHRSFGCPLWLEHTFAIIAVCCLEDTPARWVATHRQHHHRADESADPHSPWSPYSGPTWVGCLSKIPIWPDILPMTATREISFAILSTGGSSVT